MYYAFKVAVLECTKPSQLARLITNPQGMRRQIGGRLWRVGDRTCNVQSDAASTGNYALRDAA